ncbi:MAG: Stp1/IreP family PP2C-type Ser/Thr phosphatase [Clostridia bacterium]|nr:Stp1/IreP family PP2C-type Ser/Thr phosphatase [Clostridia bacterium]
MEFVSRTDVGKIREENQDSACAFVHNGFLIGIVADGMGGHNGGAQASKMAVDCVKAYLLEQLCIDDDADAVIKYLHGAYAQATEMIFARAQKETELRGMGTTLTVALLRDGKAIVSNIGDSRAYLFDGELKQLTVDQTWVQHLIDSGEITREQAKTHPHRHVILKAVGTEAEVVPEIYTADVTGKTILLCSDGLSGEVEDVQLKEILGMQKDLAQTADIMISCANAVGGEDNITVVLLCEKSKRNYTVKG